jgi:hypothetical protein
MVKVEYYGILIVVLYSTMLALVPKKPNKHLLPLKYPFILICVEAGLAPVMFFVFTILSVKRFNRLYFLASVAPS